MNMMETVKNCFACAQMQVVNLDVSNTRVLIDVLSTDAVACYFSFSPMGQLVVPECRKVKNLRVLKLAALCQIRFIPVKFVQYRFHMPKILGDC